MRWVVALLLLGGCTSFGAPHDASQASIRFGTGFRIGPEHLLTAAHVVDGCPALAAEGPGGARPASVVASDTELDVAVLRTAPVPPPYATLASTSPPPGAALTAVGYPGPAVSGHPEHVPFRVILLPLSQSDERTALRGVARHGMSGSPVLDGNGAVVGMLVAKGDGSSPWSSQLARQLGFAVDDIALLVPAPWLRAMAAVGGVGASPTSAPILEPVPERIMCGATAIEAVQRQAWLDHWLKEPDYL